MLLSSIHYAIMFSIITFILGMALASVVAVDAVLLDERAKTASYTVENVGTFNSHFSLKFASFSSLPSPLVASTKTIGAGTAPHSRQFNASNIITTTGQPLRMLVPGAQHTSPIQCAEMTTSYNDVLYGSIRTVARASNISGVVHGFFMYRNDTQETDIEIRTVDLANIYWTNQQVRSGSPVTSVTTRAPANITSAFHEYRLDWLPNRCDFYLDGTLQHTLTGNVPSQPGYLIWNQWTNGNSFTKGPPLHDSILEIQSIEAYFNRTSLH